MILLLSPAFACTPLPDAVERLAQAVLTRADAGPARAEVSTSLGCAPASADDVAHYFLIEGAALMLDGDPAGMSWFAASHRLTPDRWDPRFGTQLQAAWLGARAPGAARLSVDASAMVDGAPAGAFPMLVEAGPHVVQVIGRSGNVRYGRVIELEADEDAMVPTGLGPEAEVEALATAASPRKKSPAMLVVAGSAAVLAGAAVAGAYLEQDYIDRMGASSTSTREDIETAWTLEQVFGYSAYGLAGLSALGVGLYVALPW